MALVSALGVLSEKLGDLVSPRQAQRSGLHQSFMAGAGQGEGDPNTLTIYAHTCTHTHIPTNTHLKTQTHIVWYHNEVTYL